MFSSRRFTLVLLLVLTIAGGLWYRAHPRLARNLLFGRTKGCSLSQSAAGDRFLNQQLETARGLALSGKLLAREQGLEQWRTSMGTYWIPQGSSTALFYDLSEQHRKIYGAGERGARSGDVVLDCGANVGVYTREALDRGAKLVVAIEPAPENVEVLRRNFAPEMAAGRVIVYPKGVWDKDDVLKLQVDPRNSARDSFVADLSGPGVHSIDIPLTTIDKLVAELNLPRVDFIKMDIEGAERKAVAGASHTIAQYHPRMALCLYHEPGDPLDVPATVARAYNGYQLEVTCICSDERIGPEVGHFF
ncbi:MAG: FkbM family methyltransferase [Acidobacteriia bacterium]|nr:FkbM family methyltransferase [Terriglobia bacterium]